MGRTVRACAAARGGDVAYSCARDSSMQVVWDPINAAANEAAHGINMESEQTTEGGV